MCRLDNAYLFYLVGASGVGKDTLIDYCRTHLPPDAGVHIARRYITRPQTVGGETHIELTPAEFDQYRRTGRFALHWRANDCGYGLDRDIDDCLNDGMRVLANGSRAHVPAARRRYGARLVVTEIRAEATTIQARLTRRGRETADVIAARMQRTRQLHGRASIAAVQVIDNNQDVRTAGNRLLALLTAPDPRRWR